MNVLHINQADIAGGASIAGYRLHLGLQYKGVNSRLLVGTMTATDANITPIPSWSWADILLHQATKRLGLNNTNFLSTFTVSNHPFFQEADILNFHNLHGYFNYLALPHLTKNKPAIFTLHDMWSFTGHCTYSYDCNRWINGCGNCPYPEIHLAIQRDSTNLEWKLKTWVYKHFNGIVVAPSQWLTKLAQQSILNCLPIYHIPYGIDTTAYHPLNPDQCRNELGIPKDKYVLMFSAANLDDFRKGGDLLLGALSNLPESIKNETVLLTVGAIGKNLFKLTEIETLNLGYLTEDRQKAVAYSAADLFILPSRADNLPIVLQESMSCGTPMVAFNIGGVSDLVHSGVTGYLAEPEQASDMCNGIIRLLEDKQLRKQMEQNCRDLILKEYTLDLQAQRYIELYHQILHPTNKIKTDI
ncbi:MAG: glycosyltransferase family 4 protein [Anaerolineae bacterium]|nr:glycosyltransferase family 4 protein [Anaerolineae bacterium]